MPSYHATVGRERKLSSLAANLYRIDPGPGRATRLKQAEEALLRANPQLRDRANFRTGATVVVPGDIGLAPSDRVERPRPERLDGTLKEAETRFRIAGQNLQKAFDSGAKKSEKSLAFLSDRSVAAKLRKALPNSAPILEKTRDTLRKEQERSAEQRDRLARAVDTALEEIARLQARAARLTPDGD